MQTETCINTYFKKNLTTRLVGWNLCALELKMHWRELETQNIREQKLQHNQLIWSAPLIIYPANQFTVPSFDYWSCYSKLKIKESSLFLGTKRNTLDMLSKCIGQWWVKRQAIQKIILKFTMDNGNDESDEKKWDKKDSTISSRCEILLT